MKNVTKVNLICLGIALAFLFVVAFFIVPEINYEAISPNSFCESMGGESDYVSHNSFSLIPSGNWYCLVPKGNGLERIEVYCHDYDWKVVE